MVKRYNIFILFLFLGIVFASYDFDFLTIPSGVRASGAGGNFVSMYRSCEGLFYNPALSFFCPNYEMSLAHQIYLQESTIQQLSLAIPLGSVGIGITGKMFSSAEIPYIRNYQNLGSFKMTSLLTNGSFALGISKNFSFGFGIKYVNEKIYNEEDSVFLYDGGFLLKTSNDIFSFSCSLENYNISEKYSVPTNYNIGTKLTLSMPQQETEFNILSSAKIDYKTHKPIYNFGIEHWGSNVLGLRIGYVYDEDKINLKIYDNLSFITAGLSLRIGNFGIDYAYLPDSILGTTHNLGVYFKFASVKKEQPTISLKAKLFVEPGYFSPNDDGYLDNIFFRHDVATFTNVTLLNYIIKNDKDQIVKVIQSTTTKNVIDSFYTYDGKNSFGETLENGKYSVEFLLVDKSKKEIISYSSQKEYFVVDTMPPIVEVYISTQVFSPDSDGVNDNIEFIFNIQDEISPLENISVNIFTIDNKKIYSYKSIELQPLQKSLNINFVWDGKDEVYKQVVPNGEYKIVCFIKDKAGNKTVKEEKFSIYIPPKQPEKIVEKIIEKEEVLFYIEGAKVIIDKRGIVVIYQTDDLFVKGTTGINPEMKGSLESLAEIIKTKFGNKNIIIEGHTDSVGNERENKNKSSEYAWSVYSYFVKEAGLNKDLFEVKGCGEERPIASNKSKYGRAQNRRIEIILGK